MPPADRRPPLVPRWLLGAVAALFAVAAALAWIDDPSDTGPGAPGAAAPLFDRALLLYADGLERVAGHYLARGMDDSAEGLLRRVAMARQAALGAAHPAVADALDRHAAVLARLGRDDEARAAAARAARLRAGAPP